MFLADSLQHQAELLMHTALPKSKFKIIITSHNELIHYSNVLMLLKNFLLTVCKIINAQFFAC